VTADARHAESAGPGPGKALIRLAEVEKIYHMGLTDVRALDGVSLEIRAGEFVSICGPSGSGKSTMMGIVGCLDRPTAGQYYFEDKLVSRLSDRQLARIRNRHIGFVFQTFNLLPRNTALENVAVPLFYARQFRTKHLALEALQQVGLAQRADHTPAKLSGGERQRVAIARAIVNRPAVLVADEPTGNLDSKTGAQIMMIFHELHRRGVTIVIVTHEHNVAVQAERMVQMYDGKIVYDGTVDRREREGALGRAADLAKQAKT